jgi:hypothetical protein
MTTTTMTTSTAMFNTNLTIGSRGADVTALQSWLISKGFAIAAGATGYFGGQTKAALASYQASKGIVPAVGYFGPLTRAAVNAGGSTTTTGGTTTTTTTGLTGAGRLTGISSLGDVTGDIKEGDSATSVVGVSADATDGDVALQRLDATFTVDNVGSQSANLNKYISSAAVYLDGTKLGSMDAADGDKDGRVWTLRFSGLNGVVKKGHTGNLYVKVTPLSSIGTNEDGKKVTATLLSDSLRAVGADGISETYIASTSQQFTVSSVTTGTLTVGTGSDNPKASQVAVSSSTTTGVKLLSFTLKAKNQAVDVTDLVASFGTSDNNLSDVVSTVKLMKGSTVLKSKTLSTGTYGTVTFDNLSETISKDDTEAYSIVADLKGDSAYADGVTLVASTTTSGWDVSDADGASITPSAAAVGNMMTLTATGISVAKGSITTSTTVGLTTQGDTTQYTIPFTVTAGDNDVFIGYTAAQATTYATTTSSTSGVTGQPVASFSASDTNNGDISGTAFKIPAGTSRTFTLNATYTATSTGYTGVVLTGIKYGATSALGTTYTSNLDTFKTTDVLMKVR